MKYILFDAVTNVLSARYDSEIHGSKEMSIIDPLFEWPLIEVVLQPGEKLEINGDILGENTGTTPITLKNVPDYSAEPRYIVIENPDCKIPAEAIEVSEEIFFRTIEGQDGIWSLVNGEVVKLPLPLPDPEIVKANQWTAIKFMREEIKASGVLAAGKWFHSDADGRIQHLGLKDNARDVLAAGGVIADRLKIAGQDIPWKTMDGTFVFMTAQIAFDIVAAVALLDAQAHIKAEQHKAAMEASTDPVAYDYSAGWPAVFGGA